MAKKKGKAKKGKAKAKVKKGGKDAPAAPALAGGMSKAEAYEMLDLISSFDRLGAAKAAAAEAEEGAGADGKGGKKKEKKKEKGKAKKGKGKKGGKEPPPDEAEEQKQQWDEQTLAMNADQVSKHYAAAARNEHLKSLRAAVERLQADNERLAVEASQASTTFFEVHNFGEAQVAAHAEVVEEREEALEAAEEELAQEEVAMAGVVERHEQETEEEVAKLTKRLEEFEATVAQARDYSLGTPDRFCGARFWQHESHLRTPLSECLC